MRRTPSSSTWRVLLFLGCLGVGYPFEVLDIDDNWAEEVFSENLSAEDPPTVECTPRPDQVCAVLPPLPEAPRLIRWTTAATLHLARRRLVLPSLAFTTFPRRMLGAPSNSPGTLPAAPSPSECSVGRLLLEDGLSCCVLLGLGQAPLYAGVLGAFAFTPNGDGLHAVSIVQIAGGQPKLLKSVSVEAK